MNNGFENKKVKVKVSEEALNNIIKQYKKAKKYMRTNIFTIKMIDGTETYISSLIKESEADDVALPEHRRDDYGETTRARVP